MQRSGLPVFLLFVVLVSFSPVKKEKEASISPLSEYSPAWNDVKYLKCNTAAKANYMTSSEKEVIYILNMLRMNPSLFASTVIKKYPEKSGHLYIINSDYYKSLVKTMQSTKQLPLLKPDSLCFNGAKCHAIQSGIDGYVGHERKNESCKKIWYYNGECCDYGHDKPLDIIMSLLIDEDVASLGHRTICLTPYVGIGVSIQPHSAYGTTAVLDFTY
jgi:hypothetical protein